MGSEGDNSIPLPAPPRARPAARREAIEAALRKFDGAETSGDREVRERPRRLGWATSHQRQLGALATAALIAVVSIPAALIALRDHPAPVPEPMGPPAIVQPTQPKTECAGPNCAVQDREPSSSQLAPEDEAAAEAPAKPTRSPVSALVPLERRNEMASVQAEQKAGGETPAAPAAAAPPPPPPPPPPAPATTERYAGEAATQDMVVTGSRIRSPNLSAQSDARAGRKSAAETASPLRVIDSYGELLSRLQADLKAGNRRGVIELIGFPLRVHQDGHTRVYRSASAVERDFDRIFTPEVKAAILDEHPGGLTSRDGGRLVGNGSVWLGRVCADSACSAAGPIRIREINP